MITAREIREYLQAKPFKPFLLFLSDGSSHEVRTRSLHGSSVRRFLSASRENPRKRGGFREADFIMHVTRIERIPAGKAN
jgi:hypothetical protein